MTNPVWQETRIARENWPVIEVMIRQKQRRENLRGTLTTGDRLIRVASAAERALDLRNLPEDLRLGTRWRYRSQVSRRDIPAGRPTLGCTVEMVRKFDGWYVLSITACTVANGTPAKHVTPILTCAAEDYCAERTSAAHRLDKARYWQTRREAA